MELALNISWAFLSFLAGCLWLYNRPSASERRVQWIALFLLIVILFPVISVSDDLFAAQNSAVTEYGAARKHICADAHSVSSPIAESPVPVAGTLPLRRSAGWAALKRDISSIDTSWNQDAIQNRPPPSA